MITINVKLWLVGVSDIRNGLVMKQTNNSNYNNNDNIKSNNLILDSNNKI